MIRSRLSRLVAVVGLVGMAVGAGVLPEPSLVGATNSTPRLFETTAPDRFFDVDASDDGLIGYTVARPIGDDGPEYTARVTKTTNGGIDWAELTDAPSGYWTAISTSSNGETVALIGDIAASTSRLFVSTDSGDTWTQKGPMTSAYKDVAVSGNGGTIVIARDTDGVSYSTNGGDTWTQVDTDVNTGGIQALLADDVAVNEDGTIVVASRDLGSVWRSTNGGATWVDLAPGILRWDDISISNEGDIVFGVVVNDRGYIWNGRAQTPDWIPTAPLGFVSGHSVRGAVSADGETFMAAGYTSRPRILRNWNGTAVQASNEWPTLVTGNQVLGLWVGESGDHFIVVNENQGIFASATAIPPPVVTTAQDICSEPASGLTIGDTTVYLTGRFLFDADVTIGGQPATWLDSPDHPYGTRLVVIAPPGNPGPADIEITTPYGTSTVANGFTYASPPLNWDRIGNTDAITAANEDEGTGSSVAVSSNGNTIAVGTPGSENGGYVSVYDWDGTAWTRRGDAITTVNDNEFAGYAVALTADGDTVAIGSPAFDDARGAVRVYDWDETDEEWMQRGVAIEGEAQSETFGVTIALSADSDTVAVGSPSFDNSRGVVRVYDWDGTSWTQFGGDITGTAAFNQSGSAIALDADGDTVAVGSPGFDNSRGVVRVYDRRGQAWTQFGGDITGTSTGEKSGTAIDLDAVGDIIAIGAPDKSGSEFGRRHGQVRAFGRNGTRWSQIGSDLNGEIEYGHAGTSVALSAGGHVVAFGSPGSCQHGTAGSITVVERRSSSWTARVGTITSPYLESGFSEVFALNGSGDVVVGTNPYFDYGRGGIVAWRYTGPAVEVTPPVFEERSSPPSPPSSSPSTSTPETSEPPAPTPVEPPSIESRSALPVGDPAALFGRTAPDGGALPLRVGEQLNVTLDDFTPNENVWIGLFSDPVTIATVKADARGVLSTAFAIPSGMTGDHTLVIYGTESGSGVRIPVRLTAPTLPVTGPNTNGSPGLLSVLATLILTLGLTLVIWVYKRTLSVR